MYKYRILERLSNNKVIYYKGNQRKKVTVTRIMHVSINTLRNMKKKIELSTVDFGMIIQ